MRSNTTSVAHVLSTVRVIVRTTGALRFTSVTGGTNPASVTWTVTSCGALPPPPHPPSAAAPSTATTAPIIRMCFVIVSSLVSCVRAHCRTFRQAAPLPPREDRRVDEQLEHERADHAAQHRRSDALHHV